MEKVVTFEFSDGVVVRNHFPDLTEEERTKRHEDFKRAVAKFCMAVERERGPEIWDVYEEQARQREKNRKPVKVTVERR